MINDFFLTEWFFDLLRWLYSVLGNNYFLTIFIVTLALRIIQILPDINNRKNQRKQAKIQPEIEKLKKKYADNPQKLSMEQNKLMRENGIGMLSSCLPLLLTLPLFFCFLAAFRFWGYEQTVRLTYETIVTRKKRRRLSTATASSGLRTSGSRTAALRLSSRLRKPLKLTAILRPVRAQNQTT